MSLKYKIVIITIAVGIAVSILLKMRRNKGETDPINEVIDEITMSSNAKNMKIDQTGLDFIKKWEGLRLFIYDDATGQSLARWNERATIGYGHLIRSAEEFELYELGISEQTAEDLLRKDLETSERIVRRNLQVPVTQNEYNALVSHAFNTGRASENLYKLVNKKKEKVSFRGKLWDLFDWWTGTYITNASTGQVVQGLKNRREDEYKLFA